MDETARLDLYHAMVYVSDLERSMEFYRRFGMDVVTRYEDYTRLCFAGGRGTIALHREPGRSLESPGIRLYFEAADVDGVYRQLLDAGIRFHKPLEVMEWGWKHAYTTDPDGHEISVFHAGPDRLRVAG